MGKIKDHIVEYSLREQRKCLLLQQLHERSDQRMSWRIDQPEWGEWWGLIFDLLPLVLVHDQRKQPIEPSLLPSGHRLRTERNILSIIILICLSARWKEIYMFLCHMGISLLVSVSGRSNLTSCHVSRYSARNQIDQRSIMATNLLSTSSIDPPLDIDAPSSKAPASCNENVMKCSFGGN